MDEKFKVEEFDCGASIEETEKALNDFAKGGWEVLVAILLAPGTPREGKVRVWLKKI